MADTADAIFDSAAGDILDALGKSASFIPRAGEPATLVVFKSTDVQNEPIGYEVKAVGDQLSIIARLSDLPDVPVAKIPGEAGDIFIISNTEYEVVEILDNDGTFVECAVKQNDGTTL